MIKFVIAYLTILSFFFQKMQAQEAFPRGIFIEAAALYWQAQEGGVSYAVKSSAIDHLERAKIEKPDFEWDFGFRCALGYRIPHDLFGLKLQFTSLQTHTDDEKKSKTDQIFFPIWLQPTSSMVFASDVKMHWRLHLGMLDAELDKEWMATPAFLLTPSLCVRTAWIRQKFNLEYRGGNFPPGENELVRMKNKYWGIGPKIGLKGQWILSQGFRLFAEGGASLLFGEFYIHQDEDTMETKEKRVGLHNIFDSSAPILEGHAGFCWQGHFSSLLKRFVLALSWDQFVFFSQNQLLVFLDARSKGQFAANQGNLSIAGVQFQMQFVF